MLSFMGQDQLGKLDKLATLPVRKEFRETPIGFQKQQLVQFRPNLDNLDQNDGVA